MPGSLRIGAVAYLNTRPLVHGLERGVLPGVELSYDVPAELARRMARGELDVALLPVIELARIPALEIVPGLGIVTHGPARSVLLVSRVPVERVRSIALDPESRTSNALAQVLCREVWRIDPRLREPADGAPRAGSLADELGECDAVVRIGDKALFERRPPDCHVEDLGEVWTRSTGLPFVWAAWIARPGAVDRETYRALHDSRRAGLRAVDAIAADYDWNGIRSPELARSYLREHIRYRLGSAELDGLARFLRAAADAGVIDGAPPLRSALRRFTDCDAAARTADRLEETPR
jgi:chorismate dehydratase